MMQPNIQNIDNNIPESRSPELVPEILWPSVCSDQGKLVSYDSSTCPTLDNVRIKSKDYYESTIFWAQVVNSKKILILDRYFDLSACKRLRKSVEIAKENNLVFDEIKILYGANLKDSEYINSFKENLSQIIENTNIDNKVTCKTKILSNGYVKLLHDRFAVTDKEVWHFGADVGGGHQSFNALSRGWDDGKLQFSKFFYQVWRDIR